MNRHRSRAALTGISMATFMTCFDTHVFTVALATVQDKLRLSLAGVEWIVSSYMLAFAGLLLVGGRLADLLGPRRAILLGLSLFTAASAAAGTAHDQALLVAARTMQGAAAALLGPAAVRGIAFVFPDEHERRKAMGMWGAIGALGLAVGPVTGGFISQVLGWNWVFLINLPVGVVAAGIVRFSITHSSMPTTTAGGEYGMSSVTSVWQRLDLPGLVTSSAALISATFALIEAQERGFGSRVVLGAFALASVATAAFRRAESRARHPMIEAGLVRNRVFSGGLLAMALWTFGVYGFYTFTSLYLQEVMGLSAAEAGLTFAPMAIAMMAAFTRAEDIALRFGPDQTVAAALLAMATSIAGVATVGADTGAFGLVPCFTLYGLGSGLMMPLTTRILAALPTNRAGVASGMLSLTQEISGLFGTTILGVVFSAARTTQEAGGLTAAQTMAHAFRTTLLVAAGSVAMGAVPGFIALKGPRRIEQGRRRHDGVGLTNGLLAKVPRPHRRSS